MTTQSILSRAAILAGSIVHRLTCAAAWVLYFRHELQQHELEDRTTEPHRYTMPSAATPWWCMDAWTDGECSHLVTLGWTGEALYVPRTRWEAPGCAG